MIPGTNELKKILKNWLDIAEPNREKPVLAKVEKVNEGSGKGAYSVTVKVVDASTLEETDRVIGDVAISPIWAGKDGEGIYAPPEMGMLVVIDFLEGSAAFPFVSGIWGQEYNCGSFVKKELVIVKGQSKFRISSSGLFEMATSAKSLKGILEKIIDKTAAINTVGSPPQHVVSPDSRAALIAIKAELAQLLEA